MRISLARDETHRGGVQDVHDMWFGRLSVQRETKKNDDTVVEALYSMFDDKKLYFWYVAMIM